MCFQVPAFILDGPTLVIYPLLALMSDQKRRMEESQLDCVVFRGGQTVEEIEENFCRIQNGAKIILANPEVLQNQHLLARLSTIKIKHIAIDEAHCVSEWGDSFRPSYLQLGKIIKVLNPPMITAFTATASPQVQSSRQTFRACQYFPLPPYVPTLIQSYYNSYRNKIILHRCRKIYRMRLALASFLRQSNNTYNLSIRRNHLPYIALQ